MTGHFTTADGCERWTTIAYVHVEVRLPMIFVPMFGEGRLPMPLRTEHAYRRYKLDYFENAKGLAHYVEVAM